MDEKKKKFLTRETKIGIAVVVAIGMLYFGINYLKGINVFKPNTYFYVQYDRVDGIVKTTHVLINGYKIGHVSDIYFDYTKEAPITLEITVDKHLVVPKGTIAQVYETGLMGDKAIQLKLGNGTEICQTGDTLQGEVVGGMIAEIVQSLMPPIERLVPQLDSTILAIRKVAEDENIRKTLANAEQATKELKLASVKLNSIMNNDVPTIMTDVKTTTSKLSKISTDIAEMDLKATINKVNATLANLQLASDKFKSKDNTLGLLLNDKQLYLHIDSTANSANQLLIDLKANPKRYVHFSVFGSKDKVKK